MKNKYLSILLLAMSLISVSSFSQTENEEPLLGLPGDDLDLYAALNLFQQSKTIEDFEKSLNDKKTGIVNLDLNNDGKVDFIKVETKKEGDDFLFILQDPISEKETQDVAVMVVSKDAAGKVSMQIIGDEKLYGKDYVIEPLTEATESVTSNPAYVGDDPVTVNVQASTKVVVVQSAPIVQYVYSPVYVPYYPPYYYGYYPSYWAPVAVISIGIYRHNHYHHHHGYHGGYGHTTVNIHNHNRYNNYNINSRRTSNTVNRNIKNGNFKTSGQRGSRPSTRQARSTTNRNRASSNRASTNRASTNRASTNRASNSRSTSRPSASRSMKSRPSSGGSRVNSGRTSGGRASAIKGSGRRLN